MNTIKDTRIQSRMVRRGDVITTGSHYRVPVFAVEECTRLPGQMIVHVLTTEGVVAEYIHRDALVRLHDIYVQDAEDMLRRRRAAAYARTRQTWAGRLRCFLRGRHAGATR